ncbi:MAG: hypothetical protein ACLR8Q_01480 [[Ruminococcus] lactaris]|uniref:hypothetical protein n=1 Tax=[Ruminococcus] lactaris TaxID=46228 RepID=UPI0039A36184
MIIFSITAYRSPAAASGRTVRQYGAEHCFQQKVIDYQEKYKAMEARESLLDSYKERSDSVKIAVLTSNYHVFGPNP